ncbi:MAG TPA: malate synthase A [Acidimicrobiales bacterium]|nr:malate synthase A [Acidimicrobiales bacterium]
MLAGPAQVVGSMGDRYDEVLNASSLSLLYDLQHRFGARRRELLARRAERQLAFDRGELPGFLAETRAIREESWQVAPAAAGLVDRRVEITGPTDRKMAINALNSGAKVWLADFEDANTPRWDNMVCGQLNLGDALDRAIDFTAPEGKHYQLGADCATITVRPRGWHLVEKHVLVNDEPVSASLFDFSMYLAHCGARQPARGLGPYYYLPKMEGHLEARLWAEVFGHAEEALGFPRATVRATVLIETLPAAFEMDEILFELRHHSAGLNAGRWDYLFSVIKKLRNLGASFLLPDRNSVTMTAPFMHSYSELLVRTCHARGAHAIGGMAAFIPSRRDAEVNARAMAKVREDKEREARAGFDGSWVAHPDLVPLCSEVFGSVLGERANQLDRRRDDVVPRAELLLDVSLPGSACTVEGLRNDVSVALQYLASWLAGSGAVAIFNLMEDAATAEIARSQIWQWVHNDVVLAGGERVNKQLVEQVVAEEMGKLRHVLGPAYDEERYAQAQELFVKVALDDDFAEFLTIVAYDQLEG